MKTIIRGLGTATPPLYATQEEAYEFFTTHCTLKPAEQDLYRRILLDGNNVAFLPRGLSTRLDEGAELILLPPMAGG